LSSKSKLKASTFSFIVSRIQKISTSFLRLTNEIFSRQLCIEKIMVELGKICNSLLRVKLHEHL